MEAAPPASRVVDRFAIDGKFPAPDQHAQLLVVGGGPTGLAAAIRGAQLGLHVVLVDENPVAAGLMGLDVPLFYGQRMTASVQEPARMIERMVASTPGLEAAFDAGVDVRLAQTVWGVFANGTGLGALPAKMAGLSDGVKSWICGFDTMILATGARDLVLGFAGVELPGVMGARALHSLLTRYDAFDGRRLVIAGSGDLAIETALLALDRGLDVAALLETLPEPQAAPGAVEAVMARGVAIRTDVTGLRAEPEFAGVAAAVITRAGVDRAERIACDTLCLAIGAVPAVELAGALGCNLLFSGSSGGHVPLTSPHGETSVPGVFCAGDCRGLSSVASCEKQGISAAEAAAAWLSACTPPCHEAERAAGPDMTTYPLAWMRTLLASGEDQVQVCLCEEITRAELLGIRPPRYLGRASLQTATRDSKTLLTDGPLNPDQIKRLTRAGMGVCQGRRCREQIALALAIESGGALAEVPLASYRAPVRPLPLRVLAASTMQPDWDVWFGIPTQWVPYNMIGTAEETALLASGGGGNMHA